MEGTKARAKARAWRTVNACAFCSKPFSASSKKVALCHDCRKALRGAEMMTCVICGKVQKRFKSGGKTAGLCCSKKCGGLLRSIRAKEHSLQKHKGLRCLLQFVKRCIENEAKEISRLYEAQCRSLSAWMHEWDSPLRARRARKASKPKGSKKHATRAKRRGLPRSYGNAMSIECVGKKDDWICRLCMKAIQCPDSRQGRWSPCVDHIVPLNHPANTRHGHTRNNVQIAHRTCNETKGCSLACPSLLECDDPRRHIEMMGIDQTPGRGGKFRTTAILSVTPCKPRA